jgi:hypothetical protein
MATPKQIAANKRNAQKSTGPKTEKGKSITRLNARRDGLTGQVITLSEEDLPIFEKQKAELIADLAPKTTMELSLANSIAWDTWRLNRLRAVEMNMYAIGTDNPDIIVHADNPQIHTAMAAAATFSDESGKFARMSIYEQRMNRSIHKNLETLRNLQAERKAHYKEDRAEEILLARYSEIKGLPYNPPVTPTLNGSVFSKHEILAATNRLTTLKVADRDVLMEPLKVQYASASSGASSGAPSETSDFPPKTGPSTSLTNLSTMRAGDIEVGIKPPGATPSSPRSDR